MSILSLAERVTFRSDCTHLPKQYRFGMAGYGQDKVIEFYLKEHLGGRILNIGSGSNSQIHTNLSLNMNVFALDYSFNAAKSLKNAEINGCYPMQGDGYDLPLLAGSIDLMISLGMFSWMNPSEQLEKLYTEWYRVANNSSHLIVVNNALVPQTPHLTAAEHAGFKELVRMESNDVEHLSGTKRRYLIAFEKV